MQRLATLLLILFLTITAQAQTYGGHHEDHFVEANGQDIELTGHHNDVVITGKAGTVTISGHHIDVVVNDAEAIVFTGHHNDVEITAGNPTITDNGIYNDIVATGATGTNVIVNEGSGVDGNPADEEGEAIVINGAARKNVYDGNGRSFIVNGAANKITIRGTANSVNVNGSNNEVHVDEAKAISVSGYGNAVTYSKGTPEISRSGVNISVSRK